MRNLILVGLMLVAATVQIGCIVPMWSSSRDERTKQLIYQSESMRHIPQIWNRAWNLDAPDFATPYRTHGGVI